MTKNQSKKPNTNSTPHHPQDTPENQREEVIRIIRCNDHYQILGVATDATIDQITQAYRNIAKKVHPDKNKYIGAEEAFKKLGNAKETLTDPGKRYDYNLKRSACNVFNRTSTRTSDASFDLFEEFLRRQQREQKTRQRKQQTNENYYHRFLFILAFVTIVLAVNYVASNPHKKNSKIEDPLYSFKPNSKYSVVRRTLNSKVRYYVPTNFLRGFRGSSLDNFEAMIEKEYLADLERTCAEQKSNLFIREMYMKMKSWIMSEEFDEIRMPACKKLENFDNRFVRL